VNHFTRVFVELALAIVLLVPIGLAQKPPVPPPSPTPPTPSPGGTIPSRSVTAPPPTSQPDQHGVDLVMFLHGQIATNDGTALPNDAMVERVCNTMVRQQVYAAPNGSFSMQLGSRTNALIDASGDQASQDGVPSKDSVMGVPRRELANCELRASVSGFRSDAISLMNLTPISSAIDVGSIVVRRTAKVEGMTLSATPYKAPKDAVKAYEKGIEAERNGKLAIARKYFEQAVQIYPKYASGWYKLGSVLQQDHQDDPARTAYLQATTINPEFLPPYLSLAVLAFESQNWTEVLQFTGHILALDPLNQANITGYIVDLDPLNYADAYFYNAFANYELNRVAEAEKSAIKAEHALRTHFLQVHLLLSNIYIQKKDYLSAISEIQTYLELVPHAKDADQLREQLAQLEKLNDPVSTNEQPDQD
jgi:tetratricopeptide (TPR) repeat protein